MKPLTGLLSLQKTLATSKTANNIELASFWPFFDIANVKFTTAC